MYDFISYVYGRSVQADGVMAMGWKGFDVKLDRWFYRFFVWKWIFCLKNNKRWFSKVLTCILWKYYLRSLIESESYHIGVVIVCVYQQQTYQNMHVVPQKCPYVSMSWYTTVSALMKSLIIVVLCFSYSTEATSILYRTGMIQTDLNYRRNLWDRYVCTL